VADPVSCMLSFLNPINPPGVCSLITALRLPSTIINISASTHMLIIPPYSSLVTIDVMLSPLTPSVWNATSTKKKNIISKMNHGADVVSVFVTTGENNPSIASKNAITAEKNWFSLK